MSKDAEQVLLENNLTQILNEKTSKIIPGNIKKDVEILGVTGTLEEIKGETKNVTPSTSQQVITPSQGKNAITEVTVSAVDSSIDANITQANIRAGVTILGVQGNLEPDKPDQTKTVTPSATQQVVEPDTGYELSSVTVNPIPLNIKCQLPSEGWSNDTYENIPRNFNGGSVATVGTDCYLFGGSMENRAYKYNTLANTYTQLANIPYIFQFGSAIAVGTDVYLFGSQATGKHSVAYKYDTLTDTYVQLTNIPYGHNSGAGTSIGTDCYLFGGNDDGKKAYKYDTLTDTYTRLTDITYNFGYGSAVSVGTDVYLFYSGTLASKYNTLTDTYTQLTNIPYSFAYGSAIAVGTDVYLFGGNGNTTKAYKYDTLTNTYIQLINIPYGFNNGSATSVGTDCYLFGGESNRTKVQVYNTYIEPTPKKGLWLQKDFEYDNIITTDEVNVGEPYWNTDKMSELTNIPYSFYDGSAVSIGTDIYLFGSASDPTTIAYKYNATTDTYTQLTNIPYSFYDGSAVSIGTDIYLFGSSGGQKIAYKYNTLTDTYTQLTNIPYSFFEGSVASIGTDVYLFGGSGYYTTAYKYDTTTDTYTRLTNIPYDFYAGSAVSIGTNIYLFGGDGGNTSAYKYDTTTDTYTRLTNIPYSFSYGSAVSIGTDIYLFGGGSYPTKVQVFTLSNYPDNSLIIGNGNDYTTELIPTNVTNGIPFKFKNFYPYTISGGLDQYDTKRYYGNGTEWVDITPASYEIVPFATATDEQISALLDAHYRGDIDLSEIWNIGDTRVIHLDAMSAPVAGSNKAHVAQDMTFRIIGFNHDNLTTSIGSVTKAAVTIECRELLGNNGTAEKDYLSGNSTGSSYENPSFFNNAYRRTWLNNNFINALPSTFNTLIKTVVKRNLNGYNTTSYVETNDKAFLLSYPEVFNSTYQYYRGGAALGEYEGTQYAYYSQNNSDAKRIKYANNNGSAKPSDYDNSYWLRSPSSISSRWCGVAYNGTATNNPSDENYLSLAPALAI